ncbi:hypothetical protein [Thomasclavelia sp.]|uniref:hypothetical protein n=1 Tax=Thomasclavelia sp. TaxID=3025757 RepID=UPI0025DB1254|nr:hypothetical protein [Thomasclavelia sp.]
MKNGLKIMIVILILWGAIYSFDQAFNYSRKEDLTRIEDTINQLCLKCYSIEGRYPPNIEYLKENYGLLLNEDDYQIVYYYEGDNLKPLVEVWQKEQNYE